MKTWTSADYKRVYGRRLCVRMRDLRDFFRLCPGGEVYAITVTVPDMGAVTWDDIRAYFTRYPRHDR